MNEHDAIGGVRISRGERGEGKRVEKREWKERTHPQPYG